MGRRQITALLAVTALLVAAPASADASATGGVSVPGTVTHATGGSTSGNALAAKRARKRKRRAKRRKHAHHHRHTTSAAPGATAPSASSSGYVFPVAGAHDFGGPANAFGAGRVGHIHQGQDVLAAEGTPVLAPHAGTVRFVAYQASGAGYYVVLHDSAGTYEFAFMHLQSGSIPVKAGASVSAGEQIGRVGHTGDAEGPHLHFEVWDGPWQTGGRPIDPLPLLQSWGG